MIDNGAAMPREFHISRGARARYQFDESLFSLSGNVIIANPYAARVFAQRMNARRDLIRFPERAVRAGQLNGMGLIDEILHLVVALYRQQRNPGVMQQGLTWLEDKLGREAIDTLLRRFADEFPPVTVHRGEITLDAYLAGETAGVSHRQIVLEEMLLLWLANANPAFSPFQELFDDASLAQAGAYPQSIACLHDFFDTQPAFGPDRQNLIDMLRSPALAAPDSLAGQLGYIRQRWGYLLGAYLLRLLSSLDLIREEEKAIFAGGPGPSLVYEFSHLENEPERFSPDRDWMPRLVLIARNTYVWLDQLAREYRRPIARLDQIPDEALDTLRRQGFTGLWLIGLWERSRASREIKQRCGNPEAVASAYSVYDYQIAADLGGEAAYHNLRERAWARGIRLASDMVPNHMGIDSGWVLEHPDWFISLDHSPFPAYTFNGPDLSRDQRVGIFLEDHYYDHTDAAVVFKRVDRWTGQEKYIYHGNDGTMMPWNDTAQLNYLRPDVREAAIQAILHVARLFPIIRFDAAMTLAKRHYQRLWFPEPGTGGAIPSRAEHGLTKQQFDALMTVEFWREVVDRAAVEAPDTLLLAEAFWLMEGYFVRTLGMHRVYNSAFMNMLRDEDNAKYRAVMKNTLEFDPEIMKRYVNFMNNPDERTAVDQFGKSDKYFGICTMMATLPGLPMFGHGQIEGLSERYGMEYRRAYWNEQPDPALVQRHEREIFPLLRRRGLFAGVADFQLYDFFNSACSDRADRSDGSVNEDVFAYSNRVGDERALVVYHNRYAEARGWIRTSVAQSVKMGRGDERTLVQQSLGEGLGLHAAAGYFCTLRDQTTGLEYIRSSQELFERGLYVELGAYKYHVFLDIREVQDHVGQPYGRLATHLDGRGVPSIDEALWEMLLEVIHRPFAELVNPDLFRRLLAIRAPGPSADLLYDGDDVERKMLDVLRAIKQFTASAGDEATIAREIRGKLEGILRWRSSDTDEDAAEVEDARPSRPVSAASSPALSAIPPAHRAAMAYLRANPTDDLATGGVLLGWLVVHALGKIATESDFAQRSRGWIDEWRLDRILAGTLQDLGLDEGATRWAIATIKLLTAHQFWYQVPAPDGNQAHRVLESLLQDQEVQQFLRVNRHEGIVWFNKETFERLLWWLLFLRALATGPHGQPVPLGAWASPPAPVLPAEEAMAAIGTCYQVIARLQEASVESEYQVEKLLASVQS